MFNFLKSIDGEINRIQYLEYLLKGLLVIPALGLFVYICLTFLKLENITQILTNSFMIIGIIYLVFIGYKRFLSTGLSMLFFLIYLIGVGLLFNTVNLGFYRFLGLLPILLLIFLPSKNDNFIIINKKSNKKNYNILNFYKNYDYDFKSLISFRIIFITIIYFLFTSGAINDYFYNTNYFGKEAKIINSDVDIIDNSFVKMDASLFKKYVISYIISYTKSNIQTLNFEEYLKKFEGNDYVIKNDKFKNLKVHINDRNNYLLFNSGKNEYLEGKVKKLSDGYVFYVGESYKPDNKGYLSILMIIFSTIAYFAIIFKNIASIKAKKIDFEVLNNLSKNSYQFLFSNIISNNDSNINFFALMNKVMEKSFNVYKRDLSFAKNINIDNSFKEYIYGALILRQGIKNLRNEDISIFFEREENRIALIFAYILKIVITKDNTLNNLIISENNEKIKYLEFIITRDESEKILKKLSKEARFLYDNLLKKNFTDSKVDEYLVLSDSITREALFIVMLQLIVYYRFIEEEKTFSTYILYFINPIIYIYHQIINMFRRG